MAAPDFVRAWARTWENAKQTEAIVRELAEKPPEGYDESVDGTECAFCHVGLNSLTLEPDDERGHRNGCLHRRAREWVEANPLPTTPL